MEVLKSGLEQVRGGAECPCICSRATGGYRATDTNALDSGICGCNCSIDCGSYAVVENSMANALLANSYS
jgi:hypothetical protein